MSVGDWCRLVIGVVWWLVVGGWLLTVHDWQLSVGGWWLAVDGWRRRCLAAAAAFSGGCWPFGGWRSRLAADGWRFKLAVGGWRLTICGFRMAVDDWWFSVFGW